MSLAALQRRSVQFIDPVQLLKAVGALIEAAPDDLISLRDAAKIRGVSYECLYESGTKHRKFPVVRMSNNRLYMRKSDLDAMPPVKHRTARKFRPDWHPGKPIERPCNPVKAKKVVCSDDFDGLGIG